MVDVTNEWQRLSPWAIFHFAAKAVFQNVQALIFAAPATYGASRWGNGELAWIIPIGVIVAVLIGSLITYLFYSYRVLEESIQVRRGAFFKKHLDLSFRRIQNVTIEHPFYFRPLGRVTLKIDGAGSTGEEVNVAALELTQAEAVRKYIVRQKNKLDPKVVAGEEIPLDPAEQEDEAFFSRSLFDLIVHGLTNNRSFIAVAGALAILWQSNLSPADMIDRLGIGFDVVIAGMSLVRLALLFVISLILAIGVIAALSVLVAIFTYYRFSMYRTADGLRVKRGLLTKHEIHVRKSRIQTIMLRQDWLDWLLGRRNVILELVSHSQSQDDPWNAQKKRIFVPSVRVPETPTILDEILPRCRFDDLPFTPINVRYFYKHTAITSALYIAALAVSLWLPDAVDWLTLALLLLWPLHIVGIYMSWRRGGLAVDGEVVVARSGTIGIDYRIFPAYKVQDVTHIQSVLMRRHNLSSLRFHTASSTIKVPCMNTDFMRSVVDYCAFRVESTQRSWM
jgi:putative membrane protein